MAPGIDSRHLIRAAAQRLTAAEFLLKNAMNLDAIYLAGYTVECALKALLLTYRPRMFTEFAGSGWHSYERLKDKLKTAGVHFPAEVTRCLRQVSSWRSELRYSTGRRPTQEAKQFCRAAKDIYEWAQRRIR